MEKYFTITEKGRNINAKIYCKDINSINRAIIACHGFAGHKDNSSTKRFAEHIMKKFRDTAVISYDAPGHGDDVKKLVVLSDCLEYLDTVANYTKDHYTGNIYGFANSFGGYTMLNYLSEYGNPFKYISLRCPAINMYKTTVSLITKESDLKALSRGKPVKAGFDRIVHINQQFLDDLKNSDLFKKDFSSCSDNIIIFHGTKDEIAPFEDSKDFTEKNSILFIPVEGADHRFRDIGKLDLTFKETIEFFEF